MTAIRSTHHNKTNIKFEQKQSTKILKNYKQTNKTLMTLTLVSNDKKYRQSEVIASTTQHGVTNVQNKLGIHVSIENLIQLIELIGI